MDKDLITLYRKLGYNGPLPDSPGGPGVRSRFMAFEDITPDEIDELPPLDLKGVEELEKMYEKDPEKMIKRMNALNELPMTPEYCGALIEQARNALTHPKEFLRQMDAGIEFERMSASAPPSWPEKYPHYADIEIKPHSHKYEPRADLLGWIINSGTFFLAAELGFCDKKIFRFHNKDGRGDFAYTMKDTNGAPFESGRPVKIGLFADFGTGEYHSRYIARHLETKFELDYAIHLGDVYYAGRTSEFQKFMWEPLKNLMSKARMFWMAGNHEKYSCYKPYYRFMDDKKQVGPEGFQEQEGSYFCIRSDQYQVIGIDTAFFKDGRYKKKELKDWLDDRLREGMEHSPPLINILLSPNEPFDLDSKRSKKRKGLLKDLSEFVDQNLIHLWFWGNKHYAALYNKTEGIPFFGSCIGHAGHPINKKKIKNAVEKNKKKGLAPAMWVDNSFKFPRGDFGRLRPDLNNHGFCIMTLHKDRVVLEYYDWLMQLLNTVDLPTNVLT